MGLNLLKALTSAAVILAVAEVSQRHPRWGALLLTLPLVSILAFVNAWTSHHDLASVSRLARDTLVLVPLGLPFFIPLALAPRWGLGFWTALALGVAFASTTIGLWLWLSPPAE